VITLLRFLLIKSNNQSLRQEAVLLSLSMMYIEHILQSLCIFSVCYFCCLLLSTALHIKYCTLSPAVFETNVFVLCMYREIDGDKD